MRLNWRGAEAPRLFLRIYILCLRGDPRVMGDYYRKNALATLHGTCARDTLALAGSARERSAAQVSDTAPVVRCRGESRFCVRHYL